MPPPQLMICMANMCCLNECLALQVFQAAFGDDLATVLPFDQNSASCIRPPPFLTSMCSHFLLKTPNNYPELHYSGFSTDQYTFHCQILRLVMCYGPETRYYCGVPDCGSYITRSWTLVRKCWVAELGERCTLRRPTSSVRNTHGMLCHFDEWIERLENLERRREAEEAKTREAMERVGQRQPRDF
jgi:hypothetical protein